MPRGKSDFGRLVEYGIDKGRLIWLSTMLPVPAGGTGHHRRYSDNDVKFLALADALCDLWVPQHKIQALVGKLGSSGMWAFTSDHEYVIPIDGSASMFDAARRHVAIAFIDVGFIVGDVMAYWKH